MRKAGSGGNTATTAWALLVVIAIAASIVLGIAQVNKMKAGSAGELAALFTWAEHKCDGELMRGVLETLESYRSTHHDAYNAGFVATRLKIEKTRKTVGLTTTCDLLVGHYTDAIESRSISAGLWTPRFPEPAWRLPDSKPAAALPLLPKQGPMLPVPAPESPTRPPWVTFSAAEVAVLKLSITHRLQGCWTLPSANGAEIPIVTLRWQLKADGHLDGDPIVLQPRDDAAFRIAATAALRAVRDCVPFMLPQDKYSAWRTITWEFDPSQVTEAQGPKRTQRELLAELDALGHPPAHEDTVVGGVALKLIPPTGYCALDRGVKADASVLDDINNALRRTPNKLLSASADCTQLKEWRRGERPFLSNRAQFQIMKSFESRAAAPTGIIRSVCARARSEGDRTRPDIAWKSQAALEQVMKDVKVNETRPLGAAAEDATTCYIPILLKYTVKGDNYEGVGMNAVTTIKDRLIFYYLFAPFVNDATISDLLAQHQANVAALHAANR